MKTFFISLLIGVGMEAALVAALMVGGIGPCGPASPVSGFVLLLHAPGFMAMNALHIPDRIGLWLIAALIAIPAAWRTASLYRNLRSDVEELLPRDAPSVVAIQELRQRMAGR